VGWQNAATESFGNQKPEKESHKLKTCKAKKEKP